MTPSLPPIETIGLFPRLAAELRAFLSGLSPADWEKTTVLPTWTVKDITAHLVDTALRRLSGGRDRYRPPGPAPAIATYADLARHITSVADDWVAAARPISPTVLLDLLDRIEPQLYAYFAALDPHAEARASVVWAGEERSPVWFDVAREYTERWHHQMQIREAFGDRGIQTPELYAPVLQAFARALPFHYRSVAADRGTVVRLAINGAAGGSWYVVRDREAWRLSLDPLEPVAASLEVSEESAWKIFTRFGAETVPGNDVKADGPAALSRHALTMACIIV